MYYIHVCERCAFAVPQTKVLSSSANQHPYPGGLGTTGPGVRGGVRGSEEVTIASGHSRGGGGRGGRGGRGRGGGGESWEIEEEDEEEYIDGDYGEYTHNM